MIPHIPEWVFKTIFALACVGALAIAGGVIAGLWWLIARVRFV